MIIKIIAAMSRNGVIGDNGTMPWPHLSADMKHFASETSGKTVVMGRKTFDSLSNKPLSGRNNIVLTGSAHKLNGVSGVAFESSVMDAITTASMMGASELYVIGGAQIYEAFFEIADEAIITFIDADYAGDTKMPRDILYGGEFQSLWGKILKTKASEPRAIVHYMRRCK